VAKWAQLGGGGKHTAGNLLGRSQIADLERINLVLSAPGSILYGLK
jgi:hypothetical protein